MDHDELAARTAIANWLGEEGEHSRELQASRLLEEQRLKRFLGKWGLARSNPIDNRADLLNFLNQYAIPALKEISADGRPSRHAYAVIEELSLRGKDSNLTNGRQTSLLSKLGLSLCPEIYIPYDSTVRDALTAVGKKVRDHAYCDYMEAVMSEKPAFERALRDKGLTAESLSADGMSQWLFEMRAHDKRLMLRGGFDPDRMMREIGRH